MRCDHQEGYNNGQSTCSEASCHAICDMPAKPMPAAAAVAATAIEPKMRATPSPYFDVNRGYGLSNVFQTSRLER